MAGGDSLAVDIELPVVIERQPDYTTCGPTSLHAMCRYDKDPIDLHSVIAETPTLPSGGTLGVHLAVHALRRGYEADMWLGNVRHYDPTWFQQPTDLRAKLRARAAATGLVDDPLKDNPAHGTTYYRASVYRLIGAIFLGIGSDDGNLLRIRPRDWQAGLATSQP